MNTNFKPLQDTDRINGSSFHSDIIFATPNELRHILGEPDWDSNDGADKVNMEWYRQMPDGNIFTVYDYKEYRSLPENEVIEWHIGGYNKDVTEQAKREIESVRISG